MLAVVLRSLVGGFLMGSADLVPGVSGGTIALVIGIYERLVAAIRTGSRALGDLISFQGRRAVAHLRSVEWALLLPVLTGILAAVFLLSSFLERQLEEQPTILASAFFGLVLGSVVIAWRTMRRRGPLQLTVAAVVAVVVFVGLGLGGSAATSDPALLAFFGAGALAICAMILPGISGSLILVLIGMYGAVLGAVTSRQYLPLAVFLAGAVIGLALFSHILHWALLAHHEPVIAAMVGLMAGSLRVVWPWPDGVDGPGLGSPQGDWPWALVAMAVGVAAVFLISRLATLRAGSGEGPAS